MRIFIAGATGAIGRSLVPRLIEKGHSVTAMTRSPERRQHLVSMGAEGIVCDVYEKEKLEAAVRRAEPEVVIHQLTALPAAIDPRKIEEHLAENDRIRVEGTRNLVRAAVQAGARRIVAQSISFVCRPEGGPVKNEDDPLFTDAPWPWRRSIEATVTLEREVCTAEGVDGVVLRYGYFYGPGTAYAADGSVAEMIRRRQLPIVGRGSGVFSFIHIDDAARATIEAIEKGRPGTYNIVDNDPSPASEWLPVYAEALGAPRPRKVWAFLARFAVGRHGIYYMTEQRGASNAKAKRELGWSPRIASWRTGFREDLGWERERSPIGDPAVVGV